MHNPRGSGGEVERSSVECVPAVAASVAGRAPIIVDGGFRRGTDIFRALALGATAVGVGRPYIFGLAAFGQAGVETALDILDSELRMVMRQAGTPTSGTSRSPTCATAGCRPGSLGGSRSPSTHPWRYPVGPPGPVAGPCMFGVNFRSGSGTIRSR